MHACDRAPIGAVRPPRAYPAFVGYRGPAPLRRVPSVRRAFLLIFCASSLGAASVAGCSSSSAGGGAAVDCVSVRPDAGMSAAPGACYPDYDGVTDQRYTIAIAVNDDGFTSAGGGDAGPRKIIATQNGSPVTLTLTNEGTKPHGFQVGCVSVCSAYAELPAGCAPTACFPAGASIAPIAPGASATVTFVTPIPDNVIYPFSSSASDDRSVPGLNAGQWAIM